MNNHSLLTSLAAGALLADRLRIGVSPRPVGGTPSDTAHALTGKQEARDRARAARKRQREARKASRRSRNGMHL